MIITADQLTEFQGKINRQFTRLYLLVQAYTDFYKHFHDAENNPVTFETITLYKKQKPKLLKPHEHQERLIRYKEDFQYYIERALVARNCPEERIHHDLMYMLNELDLLSRLSYTLNLTFEMHKEYAIAQLLFIQQAIIEDMGDNDRYVNWLGNYLDVFINEAISYQFKSKEALRNDIFILQNTAAQNDSAYKYHQIIDEQKINELTAEVQRLNKKVNILRSQKAEEPRSEEEMVQAYDPFLSWAGDDDFTPRSSSSSSSILYGNYQSQAPTRRANSSLISTSRAQVKTFNELILDLPFNDIHTPIPLKPLFGRLPEDELSVNYFAQFKPYILEEVRENISKQFKTIAKKHLLPFLANLSSQRAENIGGGLVNLTVSVNPRALELLNLDHGFYHEAILIIPNREEKKSSRSLNRWIQRGDEKDEENVMNAYLAIASVKNNENKKNKIEMKLIFPERDRSNIVRGNQIKIHWLCGLIPSKRMYDICIKPPVVSFQDQFIHAELPEWTPEFDEVENEEKEEKVEMIDQSLALSRLNEPQQEVIQKLLRVESGLYFLEGPPGTGKTTTAVSLLAALIAQYPDKRILVCAPSNKAVRVFLKNALELMPDVPMALTGIAKDLPEGLEKVFVHKYPSYLFDPLIQLKRCLNSAVNNSLIDDISDYYNKIYEELNYLYSSPSEMRVKNDTLTGISTMLDAIYDHRDEFQTYADRWKELDEESNVILSGEAFRDIEDNMLTIIEGTIRRIQDHSHHLESFLTQKSRAVFGTLISCGRDWLKKQIATFDIVIIDEAAQSLVPESIIPLKFKPELCIHIGDPNQLPATIVSKEAQEGDFESSMMHWMINEYDQHYEMLTIQYRMADKICLWPSMKYYDGRLETPQALLERESILANNPKLADNFKYPCIFFDIASGRENRHGSEYSASIKNISEANAVIGMLLYLVFKCRFKSSQIGVITFYAAQVQLLKDTLRAKLKNMSGDKKKKFKEVTISTVDGFQGEENDITLISSVRTSRSVGFLNDSRRTNVAMTRAKYARWIFGHADALEHSNSDYPSLIHYHRTEEGHKVVGEEELHEHVTISP